MINLFDNDDEYEAVIEDDTIEFLAHKEEVGAIPEPVPAHSVKPDWFRNLAPNTDGSEVRPMTDKEETRRTTQE